MSERHDLSEENENGEIICCLTQHLNTAAMVCSICATEVNIVAGSASGSGPQNEMPA